MAEKRSLQVLGVVIGVLSVLVLVGIVLIHSSDVAKQAQATAVASAKNSTDLQRLESETKPTERVAAAQNLSAAQVLKLQDISRMSQAMRADASPDVRSAVASSFGNLALLQNRGGAHVTGSVEKSMLQSLQSAYSKEPSATVRISIVKAAASFADSDALLLIDSASHDADATVRKAAEDAREEFNHRRMCPPGSQDFFNKPMR